MSYLHWPSGWQDGTREPVDLFPARNWPVLGAQLAGALVGLVAALVMAAWITGASGFQGTAGSPPRMVPLTALAFLGLSVGLLAGATGKPERPFPDWRAGGMALGGLCALGVGAARALVDLFGRPLRVDAFPLGPWLAATTLGGKRMAPASAAIAVLLGGALLIDGARRWQKVAFQICVLGAILASCLSMGRYIFGGEPLVALAQMSLESTTLFMTAAGGILLLRPGIGLVRLLRTPSEGGALVRVLLGPILLVPPLLGWLRLQGEAAGFFDLGAGSSLFSLANVVILGSLVWLAAHRLDRVDGKWRKAEAQIREQLERLHLLHDITLATVERQKPETIFRVAVEEVEARLPVDFAGIGRVDSFSERLEMAALGPASRRLAGTLDFEGGALASAELDGFGQALAGELVRQDDLALSDRPLARRWAAAGLRSLVLAPLKFDSGVFGMIVVARRRPAGFADAECAFLSQVAAAVAVASQQAELVEALQVAYRDLKEARNHEFQQERLRALGEMASGISHDINNSIAPAAMMTDLLLEQESQLSKEGRSRLDIVRRAVRDVAATVSRMQELYRRRPAGQALAPIDLNPLIEHVLELTRSRWRDIPQEHGAVIQVEVHLDPQLPRVRGIESEIRESLTNLVLNAADAMPEGGLLSLETRCRPDAAAEGGQLVVLEVRDSGVGMDEETRRRCVEPFFTTKGDRGTGLGLPMVFCVAERHEAEVEIASEPGQGTAVRLVFPAAPAEDPGPAEACRTEKEERMSILVVDDDPILLDTLADALGSDGHWVTPASSAEAALAAFHSALAGDRPFDLVFTDLGMPAVDGRRLAASIKESSPGTPVVLLTGWGQQLASEGEKPPHVDILLSKPPRLKDLRGAIRRCRRRDAGAVAVA